AAVPAAGIKAMYTGSVPQLSAVCIGALTLEQFAALDTNRLSAAGASGLRPDMIRTLSPARIATLPGLEALSPAAVAALSADQVAPSRPARGTSSIRAGWAPCPPTPGARCPPPPSVGSPPRRCAA
ncbi:hypothetical protein, partial [Mitsuaria sp. TWR114]|uniref:hypothetical protein n=1 Tax=Mitsuaria sp. TWR114 TaxID=2601731 RepID=UPI001C9B364A